MTPRRPKVVIYSFLVLLFVVLLLNFIVFRHFLVVVLVAASVAAMLGPLYDRLTAALGGRRSLAATLMVTVTTVVILVPLLSYGVLLANQAVGFFETIRPELEPEALRELWRKEIPERFPWFAQLREWLSLEGSGLPPMSEFVSPALSRLASGANHLVQRTIGGLTSALFDLILFLITLFFILRDGKSSETSWEPLLLSRPTGPTRSTIASLGRSKVFSTRWSWFPLSRAF